MYCELLIVIDINNCLYICHIHKYIVNHTNNWYTTSPTAESHNRTTPCYALYEYAILSHQTGGWSQYLPDSKKIT